MERSAGRASDVGRSMDFDDLVVRETGRLHALALSILFDDAEAEDAVQETFVRAWRRWGQVSNPGTCGPWLTRICVNYSISRRRQVRQRARFWQTRASEGADSAAGGISPNKVDIDRAYQRLSVRQRAALTLNFRYGYAVDECAKMMGCRPGTVRSHLARALASLRREIVDE